MVRSALFAALLAGALLSSCADDKLVPRTELMLVADTDISTLDTIRFEVSAENWQERSVVTDITGKSPPYTLAVVHDRGPLGPVTVRALGFQGGLMRVERSARVSFVPGETRMVPLHLLHGCIDVQCQGEWTCTEKGCQDPALGPDQLSPWDGEAPGLDAATESDAAVDAGSPSDSATPEPDAATTPDAGLSLCGPWFINLSTDVDNCGKCGKVCSATAPLAANTQMACNGGECGTACRVLWGDCDKDPANGCENYLGSDPLNCGGCGVTCTASEYCSFVGTCRPLLGPSALAK